MIGDVPPGRGWIRATLLALSAGAVLSGCAGRDAHLLAGRSGREEPSAVPLATQQMRAYPEAAAGRFLVLADFEDSAKTGAGFRQVEHFHIDPPTPGGAIRFVVNTTRTGVGAMEVVLPRGSELAFRLPRPFDFGRYSLLSLALYSDSLRDDLRVSLATDTAHWQSGRLLLRPGWNNVLVDIRHLAQMPSFGPGPVRSIRLSFVSSGGAVVFNIDDVMLIDNAGRIEAAPEGIVLLREGLDYVLSPGHGAAPSVLAQHADGLWRLSPGQPAVQVFAPGETASAQDDRLEMMGLRMIGQVDLLECNPIRVRLANTWHFASRAGEWVSMPARRLRWEYTFYGDGRCVTDIELNNAGGAEIGAVRLAVPGGAAWADGEVTDIRLIQPFQGPAGKWSYLLVGDGPDAGSARDSYLNPGRVELHVGQVDVAPGDRNRDGFDESTGAHCFRASAGNCRFTLIPPPEGLLRPVFRISGRWQGAVYINYAGRPIHLWARLKDGDILFMLPGEVRQPALVEVWGEVPFLAEE